MFLNKTCVVLLVAFLGTSWFTGVVSASPRPQEPRVDQNPNQGSPKGGSGYHAPPQYQPQPYYPPPQYYPPQPQAPQTQPTIFKTWDDIRTYIHNQRRTYINIT
ncbi:cell death-inducing p53-target protein 1 homolog isoform X30 [Spodoptera frugiperda]|uniref:Cell death-inducing p53-target protein 1 homolog isoform X18 n=1 Tax=Spodoptera frugiperda TaxID=7108 RepID=A0A9R0EA06_SPOFR|nr:cell death-inducing p53-target protein 1 homolog isoform X18 [Spodoptera frugiperda]XP_050562093.1 cell death-inducing p53-target protein 1 homolog isoform X19 [Spodoptera frugiperda]XP_050562094.1 cell death-inducing p53-target protein 1 homolog isoform X20 [Spodoptera frugiperda]XP_050562096.1 cell death-inducing p53-target protein 1 homolog isoform X22 [Spodoptera frugiperda]XP_050562097.1 cell death-inducing p53-target protein 1 homolog isoform X23 [Spodoptera frugiperda]XP_050562098.1 